MIFLSYDIGIGMDDFILLALHSLQGLLSHVGIETCYVESLSYFKVNNAKRYKDHTLRKEKKTN
jgi:hypothetical protein